MTLPLPPEDAARLGDFPPLQPPPGKLAPFWRLYHHFDPDTGAARSPFWFASAEPDDAGGGRYDLPQPLGANYWAGTPAGAWLEVFRGTLLIDAADLRRRRLARTRAPRKLHLANLLVKAAHRFGLTADIHTSLDHSTTRRWAAAWQRAGFHGIWGKVGHDPTVELKTLTLLDGSGEHEPFGWDWELRATAPAQDLTLLQEMAAWGYRSAEVPQDVIVSVPPDA